MKKICNLMWGFILSLFIVSFFSCSPSDNKTNISITVNLQDLLQKSYLDNNFSRNVSEEEIKLQVTLFDVDSDYSEVMSKEAIFVDDNAFVTFEEVPLFLNVLIKAKITQEDEILYKGESQIFKVHAGKNFISIQLSRIPTDNPTDEPTDNTVYKITYILDGGINASENPESYKSSDDSIVLKSPTKIGYTFEGWFDQDNKLVTEILNGSVGDITLSALWKKIEYTLTITTPSYSELKEFEINEIDSTLSVSIPNGYNIEGWYVNGQKIDSPINSDGNIITEDITSNHLGINEGGIYTIMIIVKETNGTKLYSAECQLKVTK